jgi:hypothetical protein
VKSQFHANIITRIILGKNELCRRKNQKSRVLADDREVSVRAIVNKKNRVWLCEEMCRSGVKVVRI